MKKVGSRVWPIRQRAERVPAVLEDVSVPKIFNKKKNEPTDAAAHTSSQRDSASKPKGHTFSNSSYSFTRRADR
jgi:hypothetical protein